MNTERNEMKQKEKKKEKGCGYWDIAAFGRSLSFFFKSIFIVIKREGRVKRPWDELLGVRCS